MLVWRLVVEKIATLTEIDNYWTAKDIFKANAVLDMKADITDNIEPRGKNK